MSSQLAWQFAPRASFHPDDFLVSASNQVAHSTILSWPKWPSHLLVLQGPAGSGKTHLAHFWAYKSGAVFLDTSRVGSVSAAELLGDKKEAILEDAASADEQGLFHLCNEIKERGGSLMLTTSTMLAPKLPDLASRLKAAAYVVLEQPDDALLSAVLGKLFADRQVRVGAEVIQYLLPRIERSFVAAGQAVAKIDAAALAQKRAVTLPLVREALEA